MVEISALFFMLLINDAAEQFALLKQSSPKNHFKRRGYFFFELNLVLIFVKDKKVGNRQSFRRLPIG